MNSSISISAKLMRSLLFPLILIFVLTAFIAYNLAAWFASDSYDKELLSAAHAVAARLSKDQNGIVAELPTAVQAILKHNDRDEFFYQVLSTSGVRVAGDAALPMPINNINTDKPSFRSAVFNSQNVRIARIRVPLHQDASQLVVVQVARTQNARNDLVRCIFLSIVIPQIIMGVACAACIKVGVDDSLRPMIELSDQIKKRTQWDLNSIDSSLSPKEMVPFIEAINSLFVRIDNHIEEQRRFVSNAAHQLRTPVAGLRAHMEYGRRVSKGNDKFSEVLNQLEIGTDRIAELVGGLLVLARAAERHIKQFENIELNDISSEVTSELMRQAANKRIELFFQPSLRQSLVVGDKVEIREMLSNIITNAITYSDQGGIVNVTVKAGPPPVIYVRDNGPGIPVRERERVFERFYRVLGTKVNGTGLGLAIVLEIARNHNATVELLEPQGSKGTLVKVTFPAFEGVKQVS